MKATCVLITTLFFFFSIRSLAYGMQANQESISELDAIIANFNNVGQEQNENQDLLLEDEKVVKEGEGYESSAETGTEQSYQQSTSPETISSQYYESTSPVYEEYSREFEEYDEDSILEKVNDLQDKLELLQRDIEDFLNDDEGEDI